MRCEKCARRWEKYVRRWEKYVRRWEKYVKWEKCEGDNDNDPS